jgi:hypothetical protein
MHAGESKPQDPGSTPPLHAYRAMGGILHSELELPELALANGGMPDWTFRIGAAAPVFELTVLGARDVGPERYQLFRIPAGLRLQYSHAGTFDMTEKGSRIVWYPAPDHRVELARAILLGPVLAIALEAAGRLCLHGSAVAVGVNAVAFIGGKHRGKSTLAMALTAAGARLISDDIVAIVPGSPALALPGVASARLWGDSARELDFERTGGRLLPGIKSTVTAFAEHAVQLTALPLAAIYLLAPDINGTGERACSRTRLNGMDAVVALAQQTKLADSLIGMNEAGVQLRTAAGIAAEVPVYTLDFVGNFARLPEVVRAVFAWHDARPLAGDEPS